MKKEFLKPKELFDSRFFTHAVAVEDAARLVYVAGQVSYDRDGIVVGKGDMRAQALQTLRNIEAALRNAGATLSDVVRTRMYVTDISRWEEIGRAHGEVFGAIRPATSMVQVAKLIDPDMLVEIEADAYVGT